MDSIGTFCGWEIEMSRLSSDWDTLTRSATGANTASLLPTPAQTPVIATEASTAGLLGTITTKASAE